MPTGSYTRSHRNNDYALAAADLLAAEPSLAERGAHALWERVMDGREKRENGQMDVVLALRTGGWIAS